MRLTDQDVEEFAACWTQEFNEQLRTAEARTRAGTLLTFYCLLIENATDRSAHIDLGGFARSEEQFVPA